MLLGKKARGLRGFIHSRPDGPCPMLERPHETSRENPPLSAAMMREMTSPLLLFVALIPAGELFGASSPLKVILLRHPFWALAVPLALRACRRGFLSARPRHLVPRHEPGDHPRPGTAPAHPEALAARSELPVHQALRSPESCLERFLSSPSIAGEPVSMARWGTGSN